MENEEAKQLVILGNGFDLKLGLPTKFENYFNFILGNTKELLRYYFLLARCVNRLIRIRSSRSFDREVNDIKICEKGINQFLIQNKYNSLKQLLLLNFIIDNICERINNYIIECKRQDIYTDNIRYKQLGDLLDEIKGNLINKKKEIEATITELNKEDQKLNFWDLYFLYLKDKEILTRDPHWNDVEKQILNFFIGKNESSKNIYYEMIRDDAWDDKDAELKTMIKALEIHYGFSLKNIDNYLYKELIDFSKGFVDYLNDVYKKHYSIPIKRQFRREFIDEKIADSKSYELLNFNYTDAKGKKCVKQIHIHGDKDKVDEIPIIGINAEDLTFNKEHAFKLTKQYQLISNENNRIEKLDLENIDKIIFYGHSLALADYQYFRNIFDRINLVESSVQLIFKYSKGYENYDSIFKLLDRYSQDIDIDVTTTLTLENRLKVEEIPD